MNRNSYAGNDPINLIDPLGLYWALTNCHSEVRYNADEEIFEVTGREICDLVWIPDFFPIGAGGDPGGGNPTRRPLIDLKKLKDCLDKLFGVTLQSFTTSQKGKNGSFTGVGPDQMRNGGNNARITVQNDVRTFSVSQMTARVNASLINNGRPPFPSDVVIQGFTYPPGPYTNYTANDITSGSSIVGIQIHELANSLAFITGVANAPVSPPGLKGDTDAGVRLERCVFGKQRR